MTEPVGTPGPAGAPGDRFKATEPWAGATPALADEDVLALLDRLAVPGTHDPEADQDAVAAEQWEALQADGDAAGSPASPVLIGELLPAGPGLAAVLAQDAPAGASDWDLPGMAACYRRLAAWAQARELAAAAEIAFRRAAANPNIGTGADGRPAHLPPEAAAEVALELRMTQPGASAWTDLGCQLRWHLPGTGAALASGTIDLARARIIADAANVLSDEHASAVEQRVLPNAGERTTTQLRVAVRRAVLAVDPDGAEQRRRDTERHAKITLYPGEEGTATLTGTCLPGVHATAAMARITAIARALKSSGAGGGLDFLRTHVYLGLLLGTLPYIPPPTGGPPDTPPPSDDPQPPDGTPNDGPGDDSDSDSPPGDSRSWEPPPPSGDVPHVWPDDSDSDSPPGDSRSWEAPPPSGDVPHVWPDGSDSDDPPGDSRSWEAPPPSGDVPRDGPSDDGRLRGPDDPLNGDDIPWPSDEDAPQGDDSGDFAELGDDALGPAADAASPAGDAASLAGDFEDCDRAAQLPAPSWPPLPARLPGGGTGAYGPAGEGRPSETGRPAAGLLDLIVPWSLLAGHTAEPACLGRIGPLTAIQARQLLILAAQTRHTQWRVIVTDDDGHATAVQRGSPGWHARARPPGPDSKRHRQHRPRPQPGRGRPGLRRRHGRLPGRRHRNSRPGYHRHPGKLAPHARCCRAGRPAAHHRHRCHGAARCPPSRRPRQCGS